MSKESTTISIFTNKANTLAIIHTYTLSFSYKSTLNNVQEYSNTTYDK